MKQAARKSLEVTRMVNQSELRLAAQQPRPPDQKWIEDIKARLPTTWAKVSTVAVALDVSCQTIRELAESEQIIGIDYCTGDSARWLIYVPSVFEFLLRRQGGRRK